MQEVEEEKQKSSPSQKIQDLDEVHRLSNQIDRAREISK